MNHHSQIYTVFVRLRYFYKSPMSKKILNDSVWCKTIVKSPMNQYGGRSIVKSLMNQYGGGAILKSTTNQYGRKLYQNP